MQHTLYDKIPRDCMTLQNCNDFSMGPGRTPKWKFLKTFWLSSYTNASVEHILIQSSYFTGMLCALLMILMLAGFALAIAAGTGAISAK